MLIGPVEEDAGSWNALVYASNYNRLTAGAALAKCDAKSGSLIITWASDKFVQGTGNQGGVPLFAIATAGSLLVARSANVVSPSTAVTTATPAGMTVTQTVTPTLLTDSHRRDNANGSHSDHHDDDDASCVVNIADDDSVCFQRRNFGSTDKQRIERHQRLGLADRHASAKLAWTNAAGLISEYAAQACVCIACESGDLATDRCV